jgi:serine-type D-Ala-D-Ala carboxypeptidase/endopeptidase (penicillin-binding protein 4)
LPERIAQLFEQKNCTLMRTHHLLVTFTTALLIAASGVSSGVMSRPAQAQGRAIDLVVPPPETGNGALPYPQVVDPLQGNGRVCPADLEAAISHVIDYPAFANARWGIDVEDLSNPGRIYSRHPERALIPASNMKLLTAAAALQSTSIENPVLMASRLGEAMRFSDNAKADALLRQVGGASVARQVLSSMGISPGGFYQVDGSGLSRSNSATPSTLVNILRTLYFSSSRDIFYSSLPVAGRSGTLSHRFRGTLAEGRVRAKTGTLTGVRALSGYVENSDYGPLVFSIVVNQPGQSGTVLVRAIDHVVLVLSRLSRC